jgi:hypothetical protein
MTLALLTVGSRRACCQLYLAALVLLWPHGDRDIALPLPKV